MAITTKDTGEPSGRNNSTGRRKDVEDREEANDTDEELTQDTDSKGENSSDEIFDGSIVEISEINGGQIS